MCTGDVTHRCGSPSDLGCIQPDFSPNLLNLAQSVVPILIALGFLIAHYVPGASRSTSFTVAIVCCKLIADLSSHLWEHIRAGLVSPAAQTANSSGRQARPISDGGAM